MGAFNEVISLWSNLLGISTTLVVSISAKKLSKKIVGCVGLIATFIISILIFLFAPNDRTVNEVINNIFNNTYNVSDVDISNETVTLSETYKNYSVCLVLREKVMYTVPLSGNTRDKAYEVYRNIKITNPDEVSAAPTDSKNSIKTSLSENGNLIFKCNSVENNSEVSVKYKNTIGTYTFADSVEYPSIIWTDTSFSSLELHEYLFNVKNSNDKNVLDSTIYMLCEGHEIPLRVDETGKINSYLFLSDGQYEFYTKKDDGNIAEHSIITIPSEGLNETNTILLQK